MTLACGKSSTELPAGTAEVRQGCSNCAAILSKAPGSTKPSRTFSSGKSSISEPLLIRFHSTPS